MMRTEEIKNQEQVLNDEQLDEATGGCRGGSPGEEPPRFEYIGRS